MSVQDASPTRWPLSFQLRAPAPGQSPGCNDYWSHELYRGPDGRPVKVFYSNNAEETERIATKFLNKRVLGFDLEWTWPPPKNPRPQDKVGLIQLACEDKIALFHLGRYAEDPTDATGGLLPAGSTLRKILQSPHILKAGVCPLKDFWQLQQALGFDCQGAFELNDLYVLITKTPRFSPYMTETKSMASLVVEYLGRTLNKDNSVRQSIWTRELSEAQKRYAASDAYAGFMLYHCLNAKRTALPIVPPLPICAETYDGIKEGLRSGFVPVRVCDSRVTNGRGVEARQFLRDEKQARIGARQQGPIQAKRLQMPAKKEMASLTTRERNHVNMMMMVRQMGRGSDEAEQEKGAEIKRLKTLARQIAGERRQHRLVLKESVEKKRQEKAK